MNKALGAVGILVLIFLLQYWSFTVGWGLEVKSWGVVIGSWIITVILHGISKLGD